MDSKSSPPTDARAWIEVDLGALVRNARALAAQARKPLIPMVKADAYGLGAVPVVRALEALDPLAYGVSSLEEAEELRRAGIERHLIHFTPGVLETEAMEWRTDELAMLHKLRVAPILGRREAIMCMKHFPEEIGWHLAIDTGMHRAGVQWDHVDTLYEALEYAPPMGAFTHFHSAEVDDGSMEEQERRFEEAVRALPERPGLLHTENSAAIARRGPSRWDCVRPGIFMYGVGTGPLATIQPEPVVALRGRIIELRDVRPGEGVSYGATWRSHEPHRIATVACGYADGLRRQLGNRALALVRGARVPIVGVVTMDMAMLEVTGLACNVGDVVTFMGRDGNDVLTVEEVAQAGGLSPYELLVGLKLRLPRIYL